MYFYVRKLVIVAKRIKLFFFWDLLIWLCNVGNQNFRFTDWIVYGLIEFSYFSLKFGLVGDEIIQLRV